MNNNCLVTKLKGTVDNPNLPYFGSIPLSIITRDGVTPSRDSQIFKVITGDANIPVKIRIEGDGYFTDSTLQQNLGKEYTRVDGSADTPIYFSPGNYKAYIIDARYANQLALNNSASTFQIACVVLDDIADLKYIGTLIPVTQLRAVKGDIASLKNSKYYGINMDFHEINEGDLYGNFNELGNAENLADNSYIILQDIPDIKGEIVEFVDTYIKAGNTHTLNFWCARGGITYNGVKLYDNLLLQNITSTSFELKHTTGSMALDTWEKQGGVWVKVS